MFISGAPGLTVPTLLERRAARHGDLVVLMDDATGESWTARRLATESAGAAAAIADAGIRPGDRVGLLSPNHPSVVIAYLALARLGAVVVPLNWRLTGAELRVIGTDAGLAGLVAHDEHADVAGGLCDELTIPPSRRWRIGDPGPPPREWGADLQAAMQEPGSAADAHPPDAGDLLYLMYTSGTTGSPKGAMHTHATTIAAAAGAVEATDFRPGDRYLNVLPLFHVASLAMVNICLYRRCTMVLGRQFDPARVWSTIAERRINAMMAVPVMLAAMSATHDPSLDTSCLRLLSTGAAPVPVPLLERYAALGIDIVQAYGLTETGGAVSVLDPTDAATHVGSAGKVLLSLEVRIEGGDGREAAPGTPGEIVVRGPSVTVGYWERPDASTAALVDGWLRTGDVGVLDPDGFLTIRDRLKDMVISGGENVYPAEVESVLLAHPAIADVAVIGRPSSRWGESPCAVVVAAEGFDAAEVAAWTRERLAGFKVPTAFEVVDELPRNASGKVLKHVLRERFPGPAPA